MKDNIKLKVGEFWTNKNKDFVIKVMEIPTNDCFCGKCKINAKVMKCVVIKGEINTHFASFSPGDTVNYNDNGVFYWGKDKNPPNEEANLTSLHHEIVKASEVKREINDFNELTEFLNEMINKLEKSISKKSSNPSEKPSLKIKVGKKYKEADQDEWNIIYYRKDTNSFFGLLMKDDGYDTCWFTEDGKSIATDPVGQLLEEVNE